jgi:cytochrome P450
MATLDQEVETALEGRPFPSAAVTRCPYGVYRALQGEGSVYQLPSGEYVVSHHADIAHLTRHPEIFSSNHSVMEDGWMRAATLEDHANPDQVWSIVTSDDPEHAVKRKIAFDMFKPGRLRENEPMVRAVVDELIDTFIDRGECEFVGEFADLLPATVILKLFGLPLDHLPRALAWGRYEGFGTRFASPEHQASAREGIMDLGVFLRDEILKRVDDPGDDDLSNLVQRHMEQHGGDLQLPSLISEASNLFIGGIITTTHLLSSMMMLFIQHPDQQATAASSTSALKRAVEEALRIESPVQMSPRLVVQDTEMGGVQIPAGSIVLVMWGAANRDACVFADSETFDVTRENVKTHMAFGNGPHFCLGAPLGRMEAVTAFERIFARTDNLRFAEGRNDFENQEAVIFRGPQRLYIEFDRRA